MPIYEYECGNNHRFETFNTMDDRYNAVCPSCGEKGELRISKPNMRIAQPIRWLTSDGKQIGWKPDGGISPPVGEPYPVGGK